MLLLSFILHVDPLLNQSCIKLYTPFLETTVKICLNHYLLTLTYNHTNYQNHPAFFYSNSHFSFSLTPFPLPHISLPHPNSPLSPHHSHCLKKVMLHTNSNPFPSFCQASPLSCSYSRYSLTDFYIFITAPELQLQSLINPSITSCRPVSVNLLSSCLSISRSPFSWNCMLFCSFIDAF